MYYIDETNAKQHVYPTYGRQFDSYRWYKPIIVGVLFAAFYIVFAIVFLLSLEYIGGVVGGVDANAVAEAMTGGYDDLDIAEWNQAALNLGGLVIMIPALALAALIVRDRPFTSYSSSRGGWNSKVFWRCLGIALVVQGLPIIADVIYEGGLKDFDIRFTLASFILVTILGPLQCIAEEYVFRGLLMQTLGSWFRFPVIAAVITSVIFAAAHPYNLTGKVAIFVSSMAFCLAAWFGRGLEASSALHIANNMPIFYMMGLNMTKVTTEQTMFSVVFDLVAGAIYVTVIFILSRKTKWFSRVRRDDAAKVNAKIAEKKARKAEKKARKAEKKAGKAAKKADPDTSSAELNDGAGSDM